MHDVFFRHPGMNKEHRQERGEDHAAADAEKAGEKTGAGSENDQGENNK